MRSYLNVALVGLVLVQAPAPAHAQWLDRFLARVLIRQPLPEPVPVPAPTITVTVIRDCPDCPEMVLVPAGTFEMGVPRAEDGREHTRDGDARPVHKVQIGQPFYLGKYHVTRGQYAAFAQATGRYVEPPTFEQTDDHPVVNVIWNDAVAYAAWLSQRTGQPYRLPSEAEWEYAARGGTRTARFWGDSAEQQCQFANGWDQTASQEGILPGGAPCRDGFEFTSPVGRFEPNAFGLYDMLGNASQWVQDCWNNDYGTSPTDGSPDQTGPCTTRVLRGSSWISYPWWLRAGYRVGVAPTLRLNYFGFRVARAPSP